MSTKKQTPLGCAAFRLRQQECLTMGLEENQKNEHSQWTVDRVVSRWRLRRQGIVYDLRHRQDDRSLRSGKARSTRCCWSPERRRARIRLGGEASPGWRCVAGQAQAGAISI